MTLDSIDRLHVIAAALDDAVLVECVLDASYDAVWRLAADLEHGVPQFEPAVQAVEILERDGESLRVLVHTTRGSELAMDVILRDGYCLMQSDPVAVGMAARPEAGKTRFAHFESRRGLPVDRAKLLDELRTLERLARATSA